MITSNQKQNFPLVIGRKLGLLGIVLFVGLAGCVGIEKNPATLIPSDSPVPVAAELEMVTLPTYVMAAPDILLIDALRIVPKDPYRIESLDYLIVSVEGTLPDQPIRGSILVDPSGNIDLGPAYGKVQVIGKSLDDAMQATESHLKKILKNPQVSIVLGQSGGQIQIAGQRIIGPDGMVSLGSYGSVFVTGLTKDQAKDAIEKHLKQYLEDPIVAVDVLAYNSQRYYIVSEGAGQGDRIQEFPLTGNETVLDAVAQIGGIGGSSSMQVWIARPAPGEVGCSQILPVNWKDIVKNGNSETNYQIMQGDRIIVAEDRSLAWAGTIGKLTQPFERIFNFGVLGSSTVSTTRRFPNGVTSGGFF